MVQEQKSSDDVIVYEAMADSLVLAWKNLNRQLELRGYILADTFRFYELTDQHAQVRLKKFLLLIYYTAYKRKQWLSERWYKNRKWIIRT